MRVYSNSQGRSKEKPWPISSMILDMIFLLNSDSLFLFILFYLFNHRHQRRVPMAYGYIIYRMQ